MTAGVSQARVHTELQVHHPHVTAKVAEYEDDLVAGRNRRDAGDAARYDHLGRRERRERLA